MWSNVARHTVALLFVISAAPVATSAGADAAPTQKLPLLSIKDF